MKIRNFSSWIDTIASIAVVIGLVLLILEIRVNTQAIERQAAVDRAAALTEPFYQSETLRSASEKVRAVDERVGAEAAFIEHYNMTPEEAILWNRHCIQLWSVIKADFDFGDRESARRYAENLLAIPDQRIFIENHSFFEGDFSQMIEAVLTPRNSAKR
jgi:hypothetical protein